MNYIKTYHEEYFQKTYAGWLGKIIGIRMGSPIEGWTYEKIASTFGFIDHYVQDYMDYAADDDSNGPLFFIRALLDFPELGKDISIKEMAETWQNYVADGHGFFWWGGYGVSTEHTAFNNLKAGIPAPRSGEIIQNGLTVSEQIGGQIFIDSWGFVIPDNPMEAANLAEKMIRVSHDGEAIFGGRFIVACISKAYSAGSIQEIIQAGLSAIPSNCLYSNLVHAVMEFYKTDSEQDWHKCLLFLQNNYGYDKYPGNCHIIPNAGVIILSLLYGKGDFSKTMFICNSCGWDTDCNAGNIGAIMGVFVGIDNIDDSLVEPIHDLVLASSVLGFLNIDTIAHSAFMYTRLAYSLASIDMPEPWKNRIEQDSLLFHFNFKKSTNSIRTSNKNVSLQNIESDAFSKQRCLKISTSQPSKIYYKTYYGPTDLTDSRYDPSFSPSIYPGQQVSFSVFNPTNYPLMLQAYWSDRHDGHDYLSEEYQILPHSQKTISMNIPKGNFLIDRIGLAANMQEATFLLDYFEISGVPDYRIDFAKEKEEIYGFSNGKLHREISQFSYSDGFWDYVNGYLSGSVANIGECFTGWYHSRNYCISCIVKPITGNNHFISFRNQGAARYYAFGFSNNDTACFLKKHIDFQIIEQQPYHYELGTEYSFKIIAKQNKFEAYINDKLVCSMVDSSYQFGAYGFTLFDGSHCTFKDFSIHPL